MRRRQSPFSLSLRFDLERKRNLALFAIPRPKFSPGRKCYSKWCINLKQEGFGGAWQIRVGRIILSTFIPTPDLSSSSSSSRLLEFSSKSLRETGNRKNSFVDPVYPYRGFQAIVQIPARPSIKFHPPSSSLLPFLSLSLSLSGNALRDWGR